MIDYIFAMDVVLGHTLWLLVIAIVVAIIARRIRLPYTVGLVAAGIGITLAQVKTEVVLTHDIIFDLVLPPLLFEAAISIHWSELRRDALACCNHLVVLAIGARQHNARTLRQGLRCRAWQRQRIKSSVSVQSSHLDRPHTAHLDCSFAPT